MGHTQPVITSDLEPKSPKRLKKEDVFGEMDPLAVWEGVLDPSSSRPTKANKQLPGCVEEKDDTCPSCQMVFTNKDDLLEHKAKHLVSHYNCALCGSLSKKINNEYRLESHIKRHLGLTKFTCLEHTDQVHDTMADFMAHARQFDEDWRSQLRKMSICVICQALFVEKLDLKAHVRKEHLTEAKVYSCTKTSSELQSQDVAATYLKKRYQCPNCSKKFSQIIQLRHHFKTCCVKNVADVPKIS